MGQDAVGRGWAIGLALALGLFVAAASAGAPADSEPPARTPDLSPGPIVAILDILHSGQTDRAESLLAAASRDRPGDPYVFLARMKSGWWRILAGSDARGGIEERMRSDLDVLRSGLDSRVQRSAGDLEAAWILGEAHCTLGRLDALRGRSWSAFRHHQTGIALLERVRSGLPLAPEPRSSIGLYRYYASRLPRSLRILGRIAGLRGDRQAGLADLRAAASAIGLQQVEAAFFRIQVLQHEEDESLEALGLARLWHARYPSSVGFALLLADVLVGLERPDAAIEVLASSDPSNPAMRAHGALLAARIYAGTGRPAEALATLQRIGPEERSAVTWVEPWSAIVRGTSLGILGEVPGARRELGRAATLPDAAGSRAAAAEALDRLELPHAAALARAESVLAWGGDPAPARLAIEQVLATGGAASAPAALHLALGRLAIRQGDVRPAIDALRQATAASDDGQAALSVRPRIRLLQALLWSGEIAMAQAEARQLDERRGRWGCNRQLELLVDGILRPAPDAIDLRVQSPNAAGEVFRLKDVGFTAVDLVLPKDTGLERVPMTWIEGYWEAQQPLTPGTHAYAFAIERQEFLLDPGARDIEIREGQTWSVRRVADPSS